VPNGFVELLARDLFYNSVLLFYLHGYSRTDQHVNKKLFHRLTFIGDFMAQMESENLEKARQEVNAVENLSCSIETPAK